MFDPRQAVFTVKSVAVIPLVESRARDILSVLSTRNHSSHRPSLVPESLVSGRGSLEDTGATTSEDERTDNAPRVTFASEDQVKVMTPLSSHGFEQLQDEGDRSPSPSPSVASTPSSEMSVNTGNIAKTVADRLSFWNRMSKTKFSLQQPSSIDHTLSQEEGGTSSSRKRMSKGDRISLDDMIRKGDKNPAEILDTILSASASPPESTEQKNSELEDKIIRECVNQFTRGGMYFAYTFGRLYLPVAAMPETSLILLSMCFGRYNQVFAAQAGDDRQEQKTARVACRSHCT